MSDIDLGYTVGCLATSGALLVLWGGFNGQLWAVGLGMILYFGSWLGPLYGRPKRR